MKILTNHLRISSPQNILKEVSSKMSISLNNHESRIKALENKANNGSVRVTKLASGSGGLSEPITNFDIVQIRTSERAADGWGNSFCCIVVASYSIGDAINMGNGIVGEGNSGAQIKFTSSTSIGVIQSTYGTSINGVWGLKLYYNFSYNIIREFYVVKFKLRQSLCSLLQKLGLNKGGVKRCLLA